MTTIQDRLKAANITLPAPASSYGTYVPFVRTGNLVFIAGQLPVVDGKLILTGRVGADVSLADAGNAARCCAINILTQLSAALDGDLDRVRRVVRLGAFISSTNDFTKQATVANGASDLMVEIFGDKGR
ncbi:MAG: RidA family protein, partial [Sphingomonadales bacterium]